MFSFIGGGAQILGRRERLGGDSSITFHYFEFLENENLSLNIPSYHFILPIQK